MMSLFQRYYDVYGSHLPLLCQPPPPQTLEREHKDVTSNMHTTSSEREQLREEDQELVKQRAKLEFDVKDLEEGMAEDQKKREQYQRELAQLDGEIRQKQAELNNIMPQYQQHKNQEERLGSRCGHGESGRGYRGGNTVIYSFSTFLCKPSIQT